MNIGSFIGRSIAVILSQKIGKISEASRYELSKAFARRCIHFRVEALEREQMEYIIYKSLTASSEDFIDKDEIKKKLDGLNKDDTPLCHLLDWFLFYRDKISKDGEKMILREIKEEDKEE